MYYTKDGYIDFKKLLDEDRSIYKFVVGGRGTGKTFGILKHMIENDIKFIFMRRTQTQVDMIKSDELNPFKALYSALGKDWLFNVQNINKNISAVYRTVYDPEEQMYVSSGAPIGYIMALSTVANIRGFDASDVDYLIYDEFIGEKHEKPIAAEGTAFLNAIETIARNRELQGKDPMKVVCLSNSTNLANAIFIELKIITVCEKMLKAGKDHIVLKDRDMSIWMMNDSPISRKKADTSLYRRSTVFPAGTATSPRCRSTTSSTRSSSARSRTGSSRSSTRWCRSERSSYTSTRTGGSGTSRSTCPDIRRSMTRPRSSSSASLMTIIISSLPTLTGISSSSHTFSRCCLKNT